MNVSFTIKDCPRDVKQALAESARINRRSQNAEAIVWLEDRARALRSRISEKEFLHRIQQLKWTTHLTADEQTLLRQKGRP